MAEAMTNFRARELKMDIVARSVGMAKSGEPVSKRALDALGPMSNEVAQHRSQPILAEWLEESDLILGMERVHVREVAVTAPGTWTRAFTLKEFVRRSESFDPPSAEQTFSEWMAFVGQGRVRQDLLGSSTEDDLDDPVNMSAGEVKNVAKEIRQLIERVLVQLQTAPRMIK
jgi:protein-tyrosine-phosphatase